MGLSFTEWLCVGLQKLVVLILVSTSECGENADPSPRHLFRTLETQSTGVPCPSPGGSDI